MPLFSTHLPLPLHLDQPPPSSNFHSLPFPPFAPIFGKLQKGRDNTEERRRCMVIVRAPIHNYRVGDTRSFVCYLCLDANPLESLRLHLYFIRSSHVPLSGCLSLTINLDKSFPSTPLRLWTRSSLWATSSSASREHRIDIYGDFTSVAFAR